MDADALIKATKAELKEEFVEAFDVVLPPAVERETVEEGKAGDHADALIIEENIEGGRMLVETPDSSKDLEASLGELGIQGGESEVLALHATTDSDLIVSDDARFLRALDGLQIRFTTPAGLLVQLFSQGELRRDEALSKLDALSAHVSEAEHVAAREALLEEGS